MKISLHKNEALEETEVKVYYPHMDTQTQCIVSYIQQCNCFLLEDLLKSTTLLRISKTCILNTTYLKCFYPYPNHRILAELKNGEQLIVSRKYIPSLKKNLKGEI